MNLNSQIDWSATDRIVSNDVRHVLLDGDWWRETSAWEARADGSSALTRVGLTRTRHTGLASWTKRFSFLGVLCFSAFCDNIKA